MHSYDSPEGHRASTSRPDAGKKKLSSVRVEKAANGFTVYCSYDQAAVLRDAPAPYVEPSVHVFESKAKMQEFLESTFEPDPS